MPAVQDIIPNLLGGVSKQPAQVRLNNQCEAMENALPSPQTGLTRRPGTKFIKRLNGGPDYSKARWHFYQRDATEKYWVCFLPDNLKVFDVDGNERTVAFPNGKGYLSSVPQRDMVGMTVNDYTFVVNRNTKVKDTGTTKNNRPYEAIVNVQQGNWAKTYAIRINGKLAAQYSTPNTGTEGDRGHYIDTTVIARRLADRAAAQLWVRGPRGKFFGSDRGLKQSLNNKFKIQVFGNCIYIKNDTKDFTISVEDGFGGNAMKCVKHTAQDFNFLPQYCKPGYTCRILGDIGSSADDYWVEYEKSKDGADNGGVWVETLGPGTPVALDRTTMPHVLISEADGTFTFKQGSWDQRKVGDVDSNPWPSFHGAKITDVFFHRNRLGFLTEDGIVWSRSNDYFDFFRKSVVTLLDDDPIDIGASHTKVSLLRFAIPYEDQLYVFSRATQFKPSAGNNPILTPKTAVITPTSEFAVSETCRPVVVGSTMYFATARPDSSGVREFFLDKDTLNVTSNDITDAVASYIPAGAELMAGATDDNILLVKAANDPNAIYCYNSYWSGNEKVQSAWHRWVFPFEVQHFSIDEGVLRIVLRPGDNRPVFVEMDIPSVHDTADWHTRLDLMVDAPAGTYNAGDDRTSYALPANFTTGGEFVAVTKDGGLASPRGDVVPHRYITSTTAVFDGDTTGIPMEFGFRTPFTFEFSELFYRQRDRGGNETIRVEGRLQVTDMLLALAKTGHVKVTVHTQDGSTRDYEFVGREMEGEDFLINHKLRVPIKTRSDFARIIVTTDSPLPLTILDARWRGRWSPKSASR